jgi:hypothetical protein
MLIGEIIKTSSERLRITVEEYKGNTFVDLRIYYCTDEDAWKPTKKGVAIKPATLDEVIGLLKKAQAHTQESTNDVR